MSLNIDYLILEEKLDAAIARMGAVVAHSEPVDCPPPDSNGKASVVVTPAEPGQGVGSITCAMVPKVAASFLSLSLSIPSVASSCGESAKVSRRKKVPVELAQLSLFVPSLSSSL